MRTIPGGRTIRAIGVAQSGLFAGTPCTVERNLPVPIHAKRVQITGGSLSFPLNALTSMFVDSSSPLFYLYTTIRAEFTYTRNNLLREQYGGGSESLTNMQRFMTRPLHHAGVTSHLLYDPRYLADGLSAGEGNCDDHMGWGANGIRGCRSGHHSSRDQWAFVLGIDHIQWIRFLNKSNSFVFSGQYFHRHTNNVKRYKKGIPVGRDNDTHSIGVTNRVRPRQPDRAKKSIWIVSWAPATGLPRVRMLMDQVPRRAISNGWCSCSPSRPDVHPGDHDQLQRRKRPAALCRVLRHGRRLPVAARH